MKITKILSLITIISTIFILAGCSNTTSNSPKFEGTWYGVDDTKIIKLEIEKRDTQYLVTNKNAYYSDYLEKNGDFSYVDFDIKKHGGGKYFAKVEKNMLCYQDPLDKAFNLMMNKNGELEGHANIGSRPTNYITLKKADKANLEEMQKSVYEAQKKWYLNRNKNYKFPEHKFPEPQTTK